MFTTVIKKRLFTNFKCANNIFRVKYSSLAPEPNIVYSKIPNVLVPNILLEEYVWSKLDKWHNKTATVCAKTGRSYSYSDLYTKSKALANFLHKFPNLKKGDRVAVILPNVPEYPIVILGIIQADLQVTTVNPLNTIDEISVQLSNSETKLIFTLNDLWPKIIETTGNLKRKIPIVIVNSKQGESTPPEAVKFEETIRGEHELQFQKSRSTEDVVVIPYSSGTTGMQKGVQITNRNVVSSLVQMATPGFKYFNSAEEADQEILPIVLPVFHIYGMIMCLLNGLALGCKLIMIPKFTPELFVKVLEEHRATFLYLVPPLILFLLNNPQIKLHHISQVRTILSGAAPIGGSSIERLYEKSRGKINVLQGYGLTETTSLTHTQSASLPKGIKFNSIGFPIPNTECKIISVDGESQIGLGPNRSGELLMRGPHVMKGYFNNVEATRETLIPNGWLRTGDIGHYDEDGHFYITDRLKELIKVKGFQVAPAELEALLREHPDVNDAAVTGVPHDTYGEVPKAFIVPKNNTVDLLTKIQDHIKRKASDYKQLRGGIVIIDSIPRTASGKILRRQLKSFQ